MPESYHYDQYEDAGTGLHPTPFSVEYEKRSTVGNHVLRLEHIPCSVFPDGHKHLNTHVPGKPHWMHPAVLDVCIRDGSDILLIGQAMEIFKSAPTRLRISYMSAGRADRRFSENEAHDLRINCKIINSFGFRYVQVLRPHSQVMLALLDNSTEADVTPALIRKVHTNKANRVIVVPDAGASSWVPKIAEAGGFPTLQILKKREIVNGERKVTVSAHGPVFPDHNYTIVDDICDGGATFVGISQFLQEQGVPISNIALCVTHAMFTNGVDSVMKHFSEIAITNSYLGKWFPDLHPNLKVIAVR